MAGAPADLGRAASAGAAPRSLNPKRRRAAAKHNRRSARALSAVIAAHVISISAPAVPVAPPGPVADVFYAERVFPGITDALAKLATGSAIAAAMDPSHWHNHKGMRGWSHKIMAQVNALLRAEWLSGLPDGIARTLAESGSGVGSAAWSMLPSSTDKLRTIDNRTLESAAKARAMANFFVIPEGTPPEALRCRHCVKRNRDGVVDERATHAFLCPGLGFCRTRCHTAVMSILGQEARATGNGVTMNATLGSHGFEIRFPPGLSAAQRMRLRLYIQAIRSDMIVNCLPGAPLSSHHSRVYDFTSTSPLAGISKKAAAVGMRDLAGAWVRGAGRPAGEAGACANGQKWLTYHGSYYIDEHRLRAVAVETSGFVTPPAHAAFRELAAEQTRREMIPSARGMAFPYKVGYAVRLRRILERVAVAILRANELQIRMFMRDCVSKVACGAGGIG